MKKRVSLLLFILLLFSIGICAAEEDYVFAQQGDSGCDVELALARCADLGFLQGLPTGADEYLPEYVPAVSAMESALGFTADGIIRLSEYEEIEFAVFPGARGEWVKEMLEWLNELGYLREKPSQVTNVYDKKYETAVKNAEKKLGLLADGILTKSEQEVIRRQPLPELGTINNVSLRRNNTDITVSWNTVKNAKAYAVIKDGNIVQTVEGKTSWTDKNLKHNRTFTYKVQPLSYVQKGPVSKGYSIEVPIIYASVSLKDIFINSGKYNKDSCYVKLGTMKYVSGRMEGNDYRIEVYQKVNGKYYYGILILENYRTWSGDIPRIHALRNRIKNVSGTGWIKSTGGYPRIVMNDLKFTY